MFSRNALLARRLIFTVGSGFALALFLIGALTLLGLSQLEETNARLETIVQEHSVKSRMATQMRDILRDRAISMLALVVIADPFEKDEEMARFYAYGSAYQKVRLQLETLLHSEEEKDILARIDALTRQNQPVMVRTVDTAVEGYTFLAFEILQREAIPLQRHLVKELDALIQIQRDLSQQAADEARANYTRTRALMVLLGILAVAVAMLVAWAVVSRTARLAAATEREGTKFQTLFETNTDGIVILDEHGFVDCNAATLEMFRMDSKADFLAHRPEQLGRNPQDSGDSPHMLARHHIEQAMRDGHAFFSWVALRPDGSSFPAEIALHAMTLDGRTVIQAIMRDVSVQRETEETLRRARDAALSATRMKSQFVANVSHEIRTPMNGIIGMTRLLLNTPLTQRQHEFADAIARSADALMLVINDLLDFSKIEAGRLNLEEADFDLDALLRDALELYAPRAQAKSLGLHLHREEAVPTWVRADPLRLRQILLNLLDNALKFTQQGEVRLQVQLASDADTSGRVCFAVTDTGPGIDADAQAHVFEAFSQGDGSITRKFGGTGLGLAICRQLAALMGGELTLDSEPGSGSTFRLCVPLAPAQPLHDATASSTPRMQFPGTRVLVAEDNPINRKVLDYMLEHFAVEVALAEDGKAAYELLLREQAAGAGFDLVLMDIQMPEWDGLTATRAWRAHEQAHGLAHTPILALTANAMSGFAETCHEAGMDGLLTKPLREEDLAAALMRWLPAGQPATETTPDAPDPSPATSTEEAPFDHARIARMCRDDQAQLEEMLQLFISSSDALMLAIDDALKLENTAEVARQAHQLKGAAAYMGASHCAGEAANLEQCAKRGEMDACRNAVQTLENAYQNVKQAIQAVLHG